MQQNTRVRNDRIRWINADSSATEAWLRWSDALMAYLNRRLYLGLFSFESHFAHYGAGDYYQKHLDAFKGQANRVLSLVTYLNKAWQAQDGGELLLYPEQGAQPLQRVLPKAGTLVVFLSEEFPHEVLPAERDRYSIAGWFRVNASSAQRVDPPR